VPVTGLPAWPAGVRRRILLIGLPAHGYGIVKGMLLGLVSVNMGTMSRPDGLVAAARAAEAAGFDSVWAGEHIVLPDPQMPPSPMNPQDPALDSLLSLTWAAAHTSTIRLATGIVILPQRNPLVLAKQVATLDVLSGGRLMLGVGAGYLEAEFRALGANFAERGAVTDEYLDAMQALWYDEHPEYHGCFADFACIDARPRPLQQPVPLVVGGHSAPAYRRAVARAHGWYGYGLTPDDAAASLMGLRAATDRIERPAELGELEISVTPRGRMTPGQAAAFAEAGVHRLVFRAPQTPGGPAQTIDAAIAAIADL
jgi:probable F420-dependent oxidoreductase